MVKRKFIFGLAPIALAVLVGIVSPKAEANISSEMDRLFNSMTNTTQPGTFKTQRRGALVGGRYTAKTKIMEPKLITFVPPSYAAGCGGIDLFGGSLSFINKDQLVQVFRAVAANAAGYAFQLALDNLFPDGAKWIEAMQKKIQDMNALLTNSCEMAQTIVDGSIGGSIERASRAVGNSVAEGVNTIFGLDEDNAAAKMSGGKTPEEKRISLSPEEKKKIVGNILWTQLKDNNVQSWFRYGNNELLEQIMSITGTVIVNEPTRDVVNSGSANVNTLPKTTMQGNLITLLDLVDGTSNATKYSCAGDFATCYAPDSTGLGVTRPSVKNNVAIKSFRQRIEDTIFGTGASIGVIQKFKRNLGSFTDEEEALLVMMPLGTTKAIRDLSAIDAELAGDFISQVSRAVALEMMFDVTKQLIQSAKRSLANSQNINKGEVIMLLDAAESAVHDDYSNAVLATGTSKDILDKYNAILVNVNANRYFMQSSMLTVQP